MNRRPSVRKAKPPCPVRLEAERIATALLATFEPNGWKHDDLAEALARELRTGSTLTALMAAIPGRHV